MKEVIILDGDYEEIENNYFQNNNKWQIERTILDSFSKKELRSFIQ
jgi:hypothetical protein